MSESEGEGRFAYTHPLFVLLFPFETKHEYDHVIHMGGILPAPL